MQQDIKALTLAGITTYDVTLSGAEVVTIYEALRGATSPHRAPMFGALLRQFERLAQDLALRR